MTRAPKEDPEAEELDPVAVELEEARNLVSRLLEKRDRKIYRMFTKDPDKKGPKSGLTTGKIGRKFNLTPQQVRRILGTQKIRRRMRGED